MEVLGRREAELHRCYHVPTSRIGTYRKSFGRQALDPVLTHARFTT